MNIAVYCRDQYRVHDHPALQLSLEAIQKDSTNKVIFFTSVEENPVVDLETLTEPLQRGKWLCGPHRMRFQSQAIDSFQKKLNAFGIPLMVNRNSSFMESFMNLNHENKVNTLILADDAEINADDLDRVKSLGVEILLVHGNRLFNKLPIELNLLPKVFTDFKKSILNQPDAPITMNCNAPTHSSQFKSEADSEIDPKSVVPFQGNEEQALNRLHHYFINSDGLKNYRSTRNGMIGVDYSSKLSVFLALGSLSVKTAWAAIDAHEAVTGKNDGSEWMRSELLWREFFKWTAVRYGNSFYSPEGIQNKTKECKTDLKSFERWTLGKTNEPFVDANMRELRATGYMSNRGRQNVASYLVHELNLPWQWGARYFEWMLVDFDPTQNYGNWAYLAGVGCDPRSFGNQPPRFFNIKKQANDYDPYGRYQKFWLID